MCGLVAVFSPTTLNTLEKRVFMQLLHADALRGHDSYGIIKVDSTPEKQVSYYKVADNNPFVRLERDKGMNSAINGAGLVLVGHNRAATKGAVTSENAHPFSHGNVTMVHNGTLWGTNFGNFEVDSEWLCHKLSESKNVVETLSDVDGAYALIWWDSDTKELNIARNTQRPLHIAKSSTTYYVASEAKMLEWILHRNKITTTVEEIPAGKLFKYDLSNNKPTMQDIPVKKQQWYTDYQSSMGGNHQQSRTSWRDRSQSSSSGSGGWSSKQQEVVLSLLDWYEMPDVSYKNKSGVPETVFAITASVTFLLGERLGKWKEDDQCVALSVPQSVLDSILSESNLSGMCKAKLYEHDSSVVFARKKDSKDAYTAHYFLHADKREGLAITTSKYASIVRDSLGYVEDDDWSRIVEAPKELPALPDLTMEDVDLSSWMTATETTDATVVCDSCQKHTDGYIAISGVTVQCKECEAKTLEALGV